jgi:hypothetical protein
MPWSCNLCGSLNEDDIDYCVNCGVKKEDQNNNQSAEIQQNDQRVINANTEQKETALSNTVDQTAQLKASKYYFQIITTTVQNLIGAKIPLDLINFPKISIGRSPENVIVIPDPEISRRHSILYSEDNKLFIEDLSSTNGTYLYDGEKFVPIKQRTEIKEDSIIKLGNNTIIKLLKE